MRIGVDTGGTHTDIVLLDPQRRLFKTLKVPTTPEDLSVGILDGVRKALREAALPAECVERFVYGTTLVTNIIVEQRDVDVGLITTEGFRDVLEIGRASRKPNIYDIHWRPDRALVPRRNRATVKERIDARGQVVVPLDEASVLRALEELATRGVVSVAVCLLHAYANPKHEQAIKSIAVARFPHIAISLSSEIVREFREYERSSTTAVNAFVMKPMASHLEGLATGLKQGGIVARPYIMRGNGGVMSFAFGKRFPVAVTHSGPVAGIVGAAMLAKTAGFSNIITFDMGGTSSDIALVAGGEPEITTRGKIANYPILLPIIDLVTIGAGGGSIAQIDPGGALRVGPRSAGSIPGPMCYGQGGHNPTVTDANLLTGRLNQDYFLAGARKIHPDSAVTGMRQRIGEPLGLDTIAAALGILEIAEAHMVNAIKIVSVERGHDPRAFTLVGFGGAGPLHAVRLAEALGIDSVLIPPAPGNTSAAGLLCADIRQDLVRTIVRKLDDLDLGKIQEVIDGLVKETRTTLVEEEVPPAQQHLVLSADLRYVGQSHELTIPLDGSRPFADGIERIVLRFHERHRQFFGYDLSGRSVELVNLRARGFGPVPNLPWPQQGKSRHGRPRIQGDRVVHFHSDAGTSIWPIYRFDYIDEGAMIDGPAIIEYPGSTLVVPPGWKARYDGWLNAIIRRG